MPSDAAPDAGEISPSLRMNPLALAERGLQAPSVSLRELLGGAGEPVAGATSLGIEDYAREIVVSGLPELRGLDEARARAGLEDCVRRLLDREVRARGRWVRDPAGMRRWMTAYAAACSVAVSFETIHDAAAGGENRRSLRALADSFRNALERLGIVDPVEPWAPAQTFGTGARMEPRHQLADPALAALLLGLDVERLLAAEPSDHGGPLRSLPAALFESLVTLSVRVHAQATGADVAHLCGSPDWPEVELIVEGPDERVLAIGVAMTAEAEDERASALLRASEQLEERLADAVIVTAGAEAHRRADGVAAVPAALLGP